jgi:3-oxoacyl-[acyl-carrier-protein] synthase-3
VTLAPVGLVDLEVYAPEQFMTAAEIARASGIPEEVIRERFGLVGKHVAARDEHVSDMCVAAARPLLERAGRDAVDAVVYFGSHWKDYLVWNVAPKVQHALGLAGFAMEVVNVSAGAPVALRCVRDMLAAEEDLRSVLLVGASKESHLLDYSNQRSRFMFNFGDGAVATLLRRGHAENVLLGCAAVTDGSFADRVRVPGGGSVHPASHETVAARMHYLDVDDPEDMKRRLDPVSLGRFLSVADEALARSGYGRGDVGLFLPIHMKRSIHEALLRELAVPPERAVYLDRFGHMSAVDPLFSLAIARREGRVRPGDVVLMLAAGTGYTWAAAVLRWGPA